MIYEMEALARTLKQARGEKGLSQRQLSARSGVPQSHISKIEKAGVDLRVSSLSAIANALDLELTLVPRKVVPAVKAITRTSVTKPVVSPEVAKAMKQIAKQIERLQGLNIDMSAVQNLQRHFRVLDQFQNLIQDLSRLKRVDEMVKAIHGSDGVKAAMEAAQKMAEIRNTLANASSKPEAIEYIRPKYQLDGDNDG